MVLPPALSQSVKDKINANSGIKVTNGASQNLQRPSVDLALTSLSNFAKHNNKNVKVNLTSPSSFKPVKTTPKSQPSVFTGFFDLFAKSSNTVKNNSSSSPSSSKKPSSVFKSNSISTTDFSTSQDQLSKSKNVTLSGKSSKFTDNKNKTAIDSRIKLSSLNLFAKSVADPNENFTGFNNDIQKSIQNSQSKTSDAGNFDIVKYLDGIFNDANHPELPPSVAPPEPSNPFDDFFNFFSGFGNNTSLDTKSPETQDTGFVIDLGFPTNASEDDNPNLRPDIQLAGLGGLGTEEHATDEEQEKGILQKLIDNPIALALAGIGILLFATRGRK